MPELQSRPQHELLLGRALLSVFRDWRQTVEKLGTIDWGQFAGEAAAAAMPILKSVYLEAGASLAAQRQADVAGMEAAAQQWATDQAALLAGQIAAMTQARVEMLRQRASDEEDRSLVAAALILLMGGDRAFRIGVTEVTRAVTAGERAALEQVRQQAAQLQAEAEQATVAGREADAEGKLIAAGLLQAAAELVTVWVTARDEAVCPVCSPLHGVEEAFWPPELGDGPPAHVNCRCWLDNVPKSGR
ncbi:MAG: hypothetical protein IMZ55_05165 [Acidobacteria bacterium]|nr:hypothetical protein [Acidobacteriota bacterium]